MSDTFREELNKLEKEDLIDLLIAQKEQAQANEREMRVERQRIISSFLHCAPETSQQLEITDDTPNEPDPFEERLKRKFIYR